MINGDDPPPLDAPASGSPESLVRALRALGREQPSDAALRATGQRLQARLNAPPITVPVQTAPVPVAGTKTLLGGRLIMAALTAAVGVGSFVFVQSERPASERPSANTAPLPLGVPVSSPAPVVVPREPATPPATPRSANVKASGTANDSFTSRRSEPPRVVSPRPAESRHARSETSNRPAASPVPTTSVSAPTSVPTEATAAQPAAAASSAQVAATTPPAAEPSRAQRPAQPTQAAASAGELALLLAARKQAHVDPNAVLRLTAQHALRFPAGVLAPEREVLAIEALRTLGRSEQADQRLRRFRAAYPDSLHTRALTTGATR